MGLQQKIKTFLDRFGRLKPTQQVYFMCMVICLMLLLVCINADYWSSADTGHQGLWRYCTTNRTVTCCGNFDNVVGYKAFLGATRAFIIIDVLLLLVFLICLFVWYDCVGTLVIIFYSMLIYFLIPLSVYGALYKDDRYSATYQLAWSFWLYMCIYLSRIVLPVMLLCESCFED